MIRIQWRRTAMHAGWRQQVLAAAAAGEPVPAGTRRIVVRMTPEYAPLSEGERDLLWDAWGLPVFEQICDCEGRRLAWECEAHGAFHIAHEADAADLAAVGEIREARCGCGRVALLLAPAQKTCRALAAGASH